MTVTRIKERFVALVWHKEQIIINSLPYETIRDAIREIEHSLKRVDSSEIVVTFQHEKIASYIYHMFYGEPIPAKLFKNKISFALSTEKEQQILTACLDVPHGVVITYGELAKRGGIERGSRFAGNVMSKNVLPLLIPCHRIILANGELGNYGGGIGGTEIKRTLIQREKIYKYKHN